MKSTISIFMAAVIATSAPLAHAGGGMTGGSTEVTQLANNVQLLASYVEQAQQTVTQMNQYAAMLRSLQKLTPNSALQAASQQLWANQNMNQSFKDLFTIVNNGQKIAYGSTALEQRLRYMNPGYGNLGSFDFKKAYKDWSDTTNGTLSSALNLVSKQADDFQTEKDLVAQLSDVSSSVDGQVQAVQAGNQIGIAMIGQMQKLRQLQMAQLNAQSMSAYTAQARQDTNDALITKAATGQCKKALTLSELRRGDSCK